MDFFTQTQNLLLIAIVVVSGLGLLWPLIARGDGARLTTTEATLLINREDARILDVRETEEYAAGHLPEARHIPLGALAERIVELEKLKDKPLIVCCAAGMRSAKACGILKKQGFTRLYNLSGGIDAWREAGLPLKKGTRK